MTIRLCVFMSLVVALASCGLSGIPPKPATAIASQSPTIYSSMTPSPDRAVKIDAYLTNLVQEGRFSGAVLVSIDDGILLSEGYGITNVISSIPLGPQSRFLIGSMDKQFTAMAVLLLQNLGKLNVMDSACDHIEQCPSAWDSITIHQLLTHTSGLADLPPDVAAITDGKDEPLPRSALILRLQDDPLLFSPGERFSYSTLGYLVLEEIVEHESGEPYGAFLQQMVFEPLGMLDTGFACDPSSMVVGQGAVGIRSRLVNWPAAYTICSSTEDLYRWDQALYTEQLVPSSLLVAMFTPYVSAPSFGDVRYGYGWFIGEVGNHKVVGHAGWIPGSGFRSFIQRYTDDHAAIIILCNVEVCDVSNTANSIADVVFNG